MVNDNDIDDLIDGPISPLPEPREKRDPKKAKEVTLDVRDTIRGVTISWLMQAFRMDRPTVRRKMAPCQPIRMQQGNIEVYDFVQAAAHLVKPKVDMKEYLKTMKPEELPNELQKEYWDARLKEQRFKVQARELWKTEDVVATFGEVFKRLKTSMQLWTENLERSKGLSPDQRKMLVAMIDGLQNDMHEQLIDMAKTKSTPSSIGMEETE